MSRLILASASPRRRELLQAHHVRFTVFPTDTDEHCPAGLSPEELVRYLALKKAHAGLKAHSWQPDDLILAADTVVEAPNGEILGKPSTPSAAQRMLRLLSGNRHRVWSGIALLSGASSMQAVDCQKTDIEFRTLSEKDIAQYIATGEPMDKAGAYAIQGGGGAFISAISGDFENVVGLPVELLKKLLAEHFHLSFADFKD